MEVSDERAKVLVDAKVAIIKEEAKSDNKDSKENIELKTKNKKDIKSKSDNKEVKVDNKDIEK